MRSAREACIHARERAPGCKVKGKIPRLKPNELASENERQEPSVSAVYRRSTRCEARRRQSKGSFSSAARAETYTHTPSMAAFESFISQRISLFFPSLARLIFPWQSRGSTLLQPACPPSELIGMLCAPLPTRCRLVLKLLSSFEPLSRTRDCRSEHGRE